MPRIYLSKWEENNYDISTPEGRAAQAESLIRRWKKSALNDGRVEEYRRHEAFLPKSLRRKEKDKRAKIRRIQLEKARRKSYHYFND